jgi:hypothetical protein
LYESNDWSEQFRKAPRLLRTIQTANMKIEKENPAKTTVEKVDGMGEWGQLYK